MVELGVCLGPHGLKGGTRVLSYSRPPENILDHRRLLLRFEDREQWYLTRTGQGSKNKLVIFFCDVEDRSESELLRGAKILVERSHLPPVESQQYYWTDLIGFSVLNLDKKCLGHVSGFIETGDHDVMRVSGVRERLVPFVIDIYVLEVRIDTMEIVIDWHQDD